MQKKIPMANLSGYNFAYLDEQTKRMVREVEGGEGKISVRTGPDYNASEICRKLGGGGHAAAAGASVPGGIEPAKKAVLDVLRQMGVQL